MINNQGIDMEKISSYKLWMMMTKSDITDEEKNKLSYERIIYTITTMRRTVANFGFLERSNTSRQNVNIVYLLTQEQALMVVTEFSDKSIVYMVRELLALEEELNIPEDARETEKTYLKNSDETRLTEYHEISRLNSLIDNTMANVGIIMRYLRVEQPTGKKGVVCSTDFRWFLSEAIGTEVTDDALRALFRSVNVLDDNDAVTREFDDAVTKNIRTGNFHIDLVGISSVVDSLLLNLYQGNYS